METQHQPMFRSSAIRQYIEDKERLVLPQLIAPHARVVLWLLVVLLVIAGAIVGFTEVPIYASGPAIVLRQAGLSRTDAVLLILLHPSSVAQLNVGQPIQVQTGVLDARMSSSIISFESEIQSPGAIRERFNLGAGAASVVTQPSIVVIARFEPPLDPLSISHYWGSVFQADVKVGSRRLISLLSSVGQILVAQD